MASLPRVLRQLQLGYASSEEERNALKTNTILGVKCPESPPDGAWKSNKATLRDLIAATGLVTRFGLCDLEIGPMALKNNRDLSPCPFQLCVFFHSYQCIWLGLTVRKCSNRVENWHFVVSHDHEIRQMTLKNNRTPLLCLFQFYASFRSHQWIQIWVTIRKRSNNVNISDFLRPVSLKFHRWPSKTIGNLFHVFSSIMYHFAAISEFKFELQSGNAQIRSNLTIFCLLWPWNFTDGL